MLFNISLANGKFLEIETDPKQTGKVILDECLERLEIVENGLIGLQYKGPKNEELWLNLRNKIIDELGSDCKQRLNLRIKFYVMPQDVPTESARELFYVQVKNDITKGHISLAEPHCNENILVGITASMAQIEHGDKTCNMFQKTIYEQILRDICPSCEINQSMVERIHDRHSQLRNKTKHHLRYAVLKDVSSLPGYGVKHHLTTNAQGKETAFGVGPKGIVLQDTKAKSERMIPYVQIKEAIHEEKTVIIKLVSDAMEISVESFRLVSKKAAIALYRCITEMHSFYQCDTVGSNVQDQYCRDLKGVFLSLFQENTPHGKKFIFDIERTKQEECDAVRRKMYAKQLSPCSSPTHCLHNNNCLSSDDEESEYSTNINENAHRSESDEANQDKNMKAQINQLKRRLNSIAESRICHICADQEVSIVFCPCGHMTCESCSKKVEYCPHCRAPIKICQKVFHDFGSAAIKISKE